MPGVPGAKQYTPARPDGMKGAPPEPGQGMRPPAIPAGEGPPPAAPQARPAPMGNPRIPAGLQKAAAAWQGSPAGQKIMQRFAPQAGRPAPVPPAAAPGGPRTPPQMPPRDMQAYYDAAKAQQAGAGGMRAGMGFKKGGKVTSYAK